MDKQMDRQLDPQLFGTSANQLPLDVTPQLQTLQIETRIQDVEELVRHNRDSLKKLEKHMGKMVEQFNEFIKASQNRFQVLSEKTDLIEKQQGDLFRDSQKKFSEVHHRLKDRMDTEAQVRGLIEKHHQTLSSFESRLIQLKKALNEKEMQFMAAQEALVDARQEISRLKRL